MSAAAVVGRPAIDVDGVLLPRVARKLHRCGCRCEREHPGAACRCDIEIAPGHRYVEYVGEVSAYASGVRYCLACARAAWGDSDRLIRAEWDGWVGTV